MFCFEIQGVQEILEFEIIFLNLQNEQRWWILIWEAVWAGEDTWFKPQNKFSNLLSGVYIYPHNYYAYIKKSPIVFSFFITGQVGVPGTIHFFT